MWRNFIYLIIGSFVLAACVPAAGLSNPEDTYEPTEVEEIPMEKAPLPPEDIPPAGAEDQFQTDFSIHSVPYTEILSGGPPKDGIAPVDFPDYVSVTEADEWIADPEAVIVLTIGDAARAYPVQILMWHEIVNDTLNGQEISVTYCPLCNTAIAFDRNFKGMVLDFGTTGRLRYSNLIMYDRQTETWWQQATGEAIAGELTNSQLTTIPAFLVSWEEFKREYPHGDVLSRDTGYERSYGSNPYFGYDGEDSDPFLYRGPSTPDLLPLLSRVLTIDRESETVAFPYAVLETEKVVNDVVAGEPVVIFWHAGTASALDDFKVAEGRDVGSATSYSRQLNGKILTFQADGDGFHDEETGSTWNNFGLAVGGPYNGARLEPVVSINHFWFSWAAFRPETRIYGVEEVAAGAETESDNQSEQNGDVQLITDFSLSLYQGSDQFGTNSISFSEAFSGGKPVVAVFYAGLCPICRVDMPFLQEAYAQYGDDIQVIAVDIGPFVSLGSEADGIRLLEDLGITFPAGALGDASALTTYRILGTPSFLFFSPEGELVRSWVGSLKGDQLIEFIQELI